MIKSYIGGINMNEEKISLQLREEHIEMLKRLSKRLDGSISQAARILIKIGYEEWEKGDKEQKNLFIP